MRGRLIAVIGAALLPACASSPPSVLTPEPIVATERAFAEDGYARGVKASFTAYAAADAIMFAPGPVKVHDYFAGQADTPPDASRPHLVWWPVWAGIARSGDLGFTTGPYGIDDARQGWYFTIWQKQADGQWKWVLDAGVDADPSAAPDQDAPATYLLVTEKESGSAEEAFAAVSSLEAGIAKDIANGSPCAYAGALAAEARLHSEGAVPAIGPGAWKGGLAARPARMLLTPKGGGASKAGDLVWTWSEANWESGEEPSRGYVVRVWQKRSSGWKIVFDELVPSSVS